MAYYLCGVNCWLRCSSSSFIALEWQGIGIVNFVWNVFSTILMFAIGYFFFEEKLTYLKAVGISCTLFGISILLLIE